MAVRTSPRPKALLAAVVAMFSVACGSGSSDVVDTAEGVEQAFLARVAETTDSAETYRFAMDFSIDATSSGQTVAFTVEDMMVGEVDGAVVETRTNLSSMFDAIAEETGESTAVSMQDQLSIATESEMWISGVGDGLNTMAMFGMPEDGWGYVDLREIEQFGVGDLASLNGSGGSDPSQMLALLGAATAPSVVGDDEIDGVSVVHYRAETSLGEMLEAQGTLDQLESLLPEGDTALLEVTMQIDAWVDGDDQLRRIVLPFDLDEIEAVDAALQDAAGKMSMEMTMDFFDYGAGDIDVVVPEGDDVVDITETFASVFELANG